MKNYKKIGWLACLLLLVSCFIPLAYYADLNENFTGFYSEQNIYGKPGVFFVFIGIVSAILIYLDKIWPKGKHIFFCAFTFVYLIKYYFFFVSSFMTYCPKK